MSLLKFLVFISLAKQAVCKMRIRMRVVDHFFLIIQNFWLFGMCKSCTEDVCTHTLPGVRPFLKSNGWVFPFLSRIVYL